MEEASKKGLGDMIGIGTGNASASLDGFTDMGTQATGESVPSEHDDSHLSGADSL
jgi:hypothetical protein